MTFERLINILPEEIGLPRMMEVDGLDKLWAVRLETMDGPWVI
jgi:hypothetical protein